jgi:hypothetical protein
MMNFSKAHEIAIALTKDGSERDRLLDTPGTCIAALHLLEDVGGDAHLDLIHAVYDFTPGLLNYDQHGNWTGSVAYENGWAA